MSAFFCSWSGGKDCCLALYRAISRGDVPKFLFTMCIEGGGRSRSHGLPLSVLVAQARALDIPFKSKDSSWAEYENNFVVAIDEMKKSAPELVYGLFGDIDFVQNRDWEIAVCAKAGVKAELPLWGKDREEILKEFLQKKFKARIIAVDSRKLTADYLGRALDEEVIEEFRDRGVDVCGENGEYHSVVVDGPIFKTPVELEFGEISLRDGYYFIDTASGARATNLV